MMKPCKHIAWITFLVGMLLVSPSAYGQVEAQQKASGFDVESLEALDELFQEEVKSGRVIGCQALVCRKGKVCYFKCFGNADQEKNTVMAKDAIFRIYSMSKPITSVAVMMLVEDGKIALDDDVAKYIPEFNDLQVLSKDEDGEAIKVDAERAMTVRDLLRHTSGLTYGFFGNTEVDQAYRKAGLLTVDRNLEEMCQKLSKIPLLYQPGQRFNYSVSTDVLGRVVEVASGMTFNEFLQAKIFGPLGMQDTFFTVPKAKQVRLAQMYRPGDDGLKPSNAMASYRFVNENEFYSGGGGLCSTTDDYLKFCQMMINGGKLGDVRILKEETIAEMTKNQLTQGGRFKFGLGVSIDNQGRYGWGGAAGTRFWIDPKNDVIGIFMVQINPAPNDANYEGKMKAVVAKALEE